MLKHLDKDLEQNRTQDQTLQYVYFQGLSREYDLPNLISLASVSPPQLSANSDYNVPTWIQAFCERLHESFANTEVNDIYKSLFIHKSSYLIIKDNQVVMA